MSETMSSNKPSEIADRLNNFAANQADFEAQQFEDSLMGEAGKTDFSDEARTRLEEASKYEAHMKSMAGRSETHDPFEAGLDALDNGEGSDALDRAIQNSPQLRRANMIAQDIARRRAEGGTTNEAYIVDQEAKLEALLNEYTESADGDQDVALRIVEATSAGQANTAEVSHSLEDTVDTSGEAEVDASADDLNAAKAAAEAAQAPLAGLVTNESIEEHQAGSRAEFASVQASVEDIEAALAAAEAHSQESDTEGPAEPEAASAPDKPVRLYPVPRPVVEQNSADAKASLETSDTDAEITPTTPEATGKNETEKTKKKRHFGRRVLARVLRSEKRAERNDARVEKLREITDDAEAEKPSLYARALDPQREDVKQWISAKQGEKRDRKQAKKDAKAEQKAAKKAERDLAYENGPRRQWKRDEAAKAAAEREAAQSEEEDKLAA